MGSPFRAWQQSLGEVEDRLRRTIAAFDDVRLDRPGCRSEGKPLRKALPGRVTEVCPALVHVADKSRAARWVVSLDDLPLQTGYVLSLVDHDVVVPNR